MIVNGMTGTLRATLTGTLVQTRPQQPVDDLNDLVYEEAMIVYDEFPLIYGLAVEIPEV